MKFNLGTQTKSTGRVKGWNCFSELSHTLKTVKSEDVPALIEAIKKELVKGNAKYEENLALLNSPRAVRGTRFEAKINARFNRSMDKVSSLERALNTLTTA